MVSAQHLLEQIEQDGNGIDMSRFFGDGGWPPGNTVPQANLTNVLGETIIEARNSNPTFSFNSVAPNTNTGLNNLISQPAPEFE